MSTVFSTRLTSPITKREYYIAVWESHVYGYTMSVHKTGKWFFMDGKTVYQKDFADKYLAVEAAEAIVKKFPNDPIFLFNNENTDSSHS